jgi:hypothetical protein
MLTSSTAYTQPFGSDSLVNTESLCDDAGEFVAVVVGWRNFSRILTVLVESINEATCQCRGLCMTEVKSHYAVGWKGAPHWEPRWEVESGIWDDRGMAMTVLVLFSTPSTLSEIVGVTVSPSPQPEQTTGDKLSVFVTITRGKTLDSAVMTTRAEMYH